MKIEKEFAPVFLWFVEKRAIYFHSQRQMTIVLVLMCKKLPIFFTQINCFGQKREKVFPPQKIPFCSNVDIALDLDRCFRLTNLKSLLKNTTLGIANGLDKLLSLK